MIVFIKLFFKIYFLLIIAATLSTYIGTNLYFVIKYKTFFWELILNPIVLKLIFIPTAFTSFILTLAAAIAYKKNLSGIKIVEHHNFAQKSDKSSLKEWLTIIVGLILYYFYLNYF